MNDSHRSALLAYAGAWSEPTTGIAQALLASCWTEQSEIIGPGYHFKGVRAVLDEIDRFHREQPGFKGIATSAFDTHGRWTRFTVALVDPDGTRVQEGWDIVEQDAAGNIVKVITFWGPLATLEGRVAEGYPPSGPP